MARAILVFSVSFFTTGCSFIGADRNTRITSTPTVPPTPISVNVTPTASLQPTQAEPASILIWLPPQFDPQSNSPAAEILKNHLDLFTSLNSGIQIDVRLKAEDGPGGLLDSLATATVAAPLALPDLVVLSRPLLEIAAIKGYVKSLGSMELLIKDENWYGYAQELGHLQESAFGLPFAGEAQMVVFQRSEIEQAPRTWDDVLLLDDVLAFPAGDPQALFTLAQYQAAGGLIQDEQGRPTLDEEILVDVLTFYQKALNAGVFPFWLTQFESDSQAWDAWSADQFSLNVTWSRQLLQKPIESGLDVAVIPTRSGQPYTLIKGWTWAVSSPNAVRQLWALRLLEHLNDPAFLGQWSAAAGYLPPHRDALAQWPEDSRKEFAGELAESARLYPSDNLLSVLGPILRQAAFAVLRQQVDPVQAADQAIEMLK